MAIPDGTLIRAAVHFAIPNASDVVNVYHLFTDSVGDITEAQLLSDVDDYVDYLMGILTTSYDTGVSIDEIECWEWNATLSRWDYVGSTTSAWAGTAATVQRLPPGTCPLVTAPTTDAHAKGKKYLPPPIEDTLEGGVFTTAFLSLLATYGSRYVSTFVGTNTDLIPGIFQAATALFKAFTGTAVATNAVGYQRRRKAGVGE